MIKTQTWTSSWWRTIFQSKSIKVYEPYLAEWPGLSLLPSPPRLTATPISFNPSSSSDCFEFQRWLTTGCSHFVWCLVKVRSVITGHLVWLNKRKACDGLDPENSIPALSLRFPSGILLTNSWLSQKVILPQSLHCFLIRMNVPTVFHTTASTGPMQRSHNLNSKSKQLSMTRKKRPWFTAWVGFLLTTKNGTHLANGFQIVHWDFKSSKHTHGGRYCLSLRHYVHWLQLTSLLLGC